MKYNTMDHKEYVMNTGFWIFMLYVWTRVFAFRTLKDMGMASSHLVLLGIILSVAALNFLISHNFARNERGVIMTTVLGYGIYTFLCYSRYLTNVCKYILIAAAIAIIAYLIFMLVYKVKPNAIERVLGIEISKKKALRVKLRRSYLGVRNIMAIAGGSLILFIYVSTNFLGGLMTTKEVKGTAVYGDEYALAENMDMFLLLQQDEWEKLNTQKKLDVLQTVLNTEGRYLSFNKKITLLASDLDRGVMGYTDYDNSLIQISLDHLMYDSSRECVETILHEAFHVSTHQYIEIRESLSESDKNCYFLWDATLYAEEMNEYTDGRDNFYDYYQQKCEADARSYALANTQVIFDRIDEYLQGESSN